MKFKTNKNNKEYLFDMKMVYHSSEDYYTISCFDENGVHTSETSFAISKANRNPSIWIYKIATYKDYQHLGLGKIMLDTVEMFAMQRRINIIEGKFYPDNEYAEPFYIKNGYSIDRDYNTSEIYKYLDFNKVNCPFEKLDIEIEHELEMC